MSEGPGVIEIGIDALAAGGDGVGRDARGRVTFVPRTAPGDRARVRLHEERSRYARGRLIELCEPSPDRVTAPCPLFVAETCGGCQWQHVSIEAQRRAKQAVVAGALRRVIAGGLELRPIAAPAPAYGWRRRARLHWVRPHGSSRAVVGFMAPRSHRVTRVDACPQLEPALGPALTAIQEVLAPALRGRGEIEILAGEGGAVHVAVHGHGSKAAEKLVGQGGIVGVVAGGKTFGAESVELGGTLRGRADWFAQASAAGNRALEAAVAEAAGPVAGARVLELYAGSGNLTRILAGADEVVAVDARPGEGTDLKVSWRRGRAADVAAELAAAGERFDLVVLDPPRAGAKDVIASVAALAPRVVYVSCDPATLGRDLEALAAAGITPRWAQPLDLMPQTSHVEVVVHSSR